MSLKKFGSRSRFSPQGHAHGCNCSFISISGLQTLGEFEEGACPFFTKGYNTVTASPDNLLVANLQTVSLERLVKSKLEVLFQQQNEAQVELDGLHKIVLEQVERPLIELALRQYRGNQVKTAKLLGINRNTLKKKIDSYKIRVRN